MAGGPQAISGSSRAWTVGCRWHLRNCSRPATTGHVPRQTPAFIEFQLPFAGSSPMQIGTSSRRHKTSTISW